MSEKKEDLISANLIYNDWNNEKVINQIRAKATGDSGRVIGEAYKSIHKKIEDSMSDEEKEELNKLTNQFKAKDWI